MRPIAISRFEVRDAGVGGDSRASENDDLFTVFDQAPESDLRCLVIEVHAHILSNF
jgi:hypothetical protein